MTGFDAFVK